MVTEVRKLVDAEHGPGSPEYSRYRIYRVRRWARFVAADSRLDLP